MQNVLTDIRNGKFVKATSRQFEISAKTLRRHRDLKVQIPVVPMICRYTQAVPVEREIAIADHVSEMSSKMYGLTPTDVRKLAYDVASERKIKHPFNDEKRWPVKTGFSA